MEKWTTDMVYMDYMKYITFIVYIMHGFHGLHGLQKLLRSQPRSSRLAMLLPAKQKIMKHGK